MCENGLKFEGFVFKLQFNFMAVSKYYLCYFRKLHFLHPLTSLFIKKPIKLEFLWVMNSTHAVAKHQATAPFNSHRSKFRPFHFWWENWSHNTKNESSLEMQPHPTHILLCAPRPHPQIHNRGIPAVEALQIANPILCHFGLSPQRIIPHGFFYRVGISFLGRMDIWAWKISVGMNNREIAFINWNKAFPICGNSWREERILWIT